MTFPRKCQSLVICKTGMQIQVIDDTVLSYQCLFKSQTEKSAHRVYIFLTPKTQAHLSEISLLCDVLSKSRIQMVRWPKSYL